MKGISATYRMSNKPAVRHSPYVAGVLRPLKVCDINYGEYIYLVIQRDGDIYIW
jgi:alpha-tubulin suppressor-like RCC1 family protein